MYRESKTKRLVLLSLMAALSAVGAYVIIPSPVGTVALDSAPGYLASLLFGGISGGVVLLLGHLISAVKSGFPLGIIHLLIAVLMGGVWAGLCLFKYCNKLFYQFPLCHYFKWSNYNCPVNPLYRLWFFSGNAHPFINRLSSQRSPGCGYQQNPGGKNGLKQNKKRGK
jgi:hypothetical protein